jgi:hypothetical protein
MTDITPSSDLTPPVSDNPGQNETNHQHSSGRHHRHSHGHRHDQGGRFRSFGLRKDRSDDRSAGSNLRKTESFLAKQFLKIAGVLFIIGAVWMLLGVYNPLKKLAGPVDTTGFVEKVTHTESPGALSNAALFSIPLLTLFVIALLLLSRKKKSVELEFISLLAWVFTGLWWIFNYTVTRNTFLFYGFIVAGALIYLSFILANITGKGYLTSPGRNNILEWILIISNSSFYYAFIVFLLFFSGHKVYVPVFTALLLIINVIIFYFAGTKNISYNKVPYMLFTGIILSLLLPWIVKMDHLIIFFSVFSVYLMVFSRYSGNQPSILLSLGAISVMILLYVSKWIFEFLPSLFSENLLPDTHLFYKGLIAGSFVLLSVSINRNIFEKLHISFSKKWFSRGTYRKILKGAFLISAYLLSFWVFNYLISGLIPKELVKPLTWFSFNCLFFIITILVLAKQRSSFLPASFIAASALNLFYPILVQPYTVNIRDTFLESDSSFMWPFLFHYCVVGLVILLLMVFLRYVNRSFGGNKIFIKTCWVYCSLFIMFLVFTEFNHLIVMLGFVKGMRITEIITRNHEILVSFLLMICAIIILFMGFVRKTRFLRIYSLIILVGIIAKIILIDIPTLGTLTKTVVFLFFGAVLLLISFFYSRLRHLFLSKHTSHNIDRG